MTSTAQDSFFSTEQALKSFYRRFSGLCTMLAAQIQGLPGSTERQTYALLTLKRILFLYFLQKGSLLNSDKFYLSTRLSYIQMTFGENHYYDQFWLPLCHNYLARPVPLTPDRTLFGTIPACNLALFVPHPLECAHSTIQLADTVFEALFDFCEQYRWCPDSSPTLADELHPDVFAYLCEQQSNQKQVGAYYTARDVTEYITRSTIVATLLTLIYKESSIPIQENTDPWCLLAQNPERYIFQTISSSTYLPSETKHEYRIRRQRYEQLYTILSMGDVKDVETLLTAHLDLQRFMQDVIMQRMSPSLLVRCYTALEQLTILDPTCGSGAFLITAMETLETLYTACLTRLEAVIEDRERNQEDPRQSACNVLFQHREQHASLQSFIVERIVAKNLYGVELMHEAVEVCQLRFYLAILARYNHPESVPPFSIKDVHIVQGNALAGSIREAERPLAVDYRESVTERNPYSREFDWQQQFPEVFEHGGFHIIVGNPPFIEYSKVRQEYVVQGYEEKSCGNLYAAVIEQALSLCRSSESYLGFVVPLSICSGQRFGVLRDRLLQWVSSLWLANFEIFPSRLFKGAFQRLSLLLLQCHQSGLKKENFSANPLGSLKDRAYLKRSDDFPTVYREQATLYTTRLHRWYGSERPSLLNGISYSHIACPERVLYPQHTSYTPVFPKLASPLHEKILYRLLRWNDTCCIGDIVSPRKTEYFVYYQEATNYWMKAVCRVPYYKKGGIVMPPPHGRFLYFETKADALTVMALMNSSVFYTWFTCYSDGFHLAQTLVLTFPTGHALFTVSALPHLATLLDKEIQRCARRGRRTIQRCAGESLIIELEEFRMSYSKPLLDEIDRVLANYYSFSEEELDFIIQYDIKYRMGREWEGTL